MNYQMIRYILGRMLGIEALLMMLPLLICVIYGEGVWGAFLLTAAILGALFLAFGTQKPENTNIYAKEGFVIVALAWILWSVLGAFPFYFSGCIPGYINCLFEIISGFTTTGSTIVTNIEGLPKSMNFWRCLTHWIGGMGVLVFVMAIIPLGEKRSLHLMRAEVPGPTCDKLVPKAQSTAKILYGMYILLSVIQVILLLFGGMDLYDSVIHTFSTAGTGGFNNRNNSVAFYDSAYIDGVLTVFMILFGINFNLYYLLLLKEFKVVFKNEELRVYLGVIAGAIGLITVNILHIYGTPLKAFRYAAFQVAAEITTTGFVTADFDLWPEFSKCILLGVMIIGACAGSTGGGIKISRLIILVKTIGREIKQVLHPKSVNIIKLDGKHVGDDTLHGVYVYFITYIGIMALSVLLVSLDNFDFTTSFSAVLTTLNNVGPGLSAAGPTRNFFQFSDLSKLVFCFDMLVGRLEIFPILMLLCPSVWRKKF